MNHPQRKCDPGPSGSNVRNRIRIRGNAPRSLAFVAVPQPHLFRERRNSEHSADSGVANVSKHSSYESVAELPLQSHENSCDRTQNLSDSTSSSSSPTNFANSSTNENSCQPDVCQVSIKSSLSIASDETLTEERVLRDEQLRRVNREDSEDDELRSILGEITDHSLSNCSGNVSISISTITLSPELLNERAPTSENRVPPLYEFVLCKCHGSSSEYFCWTCVDDGCYKCMVERHKNHKLHKSITCSTLLNRETAINRQMDLLLKNVKNINHRSSTFQQHIIRGIIEWQMGIGMRVDKLAPIQIDFDNDSKALHSIIMEAEGEFTSFKRMMSGMKRLQLRGSIIEMHDNANPVRRSFINLESINIRATEVMTNAILLETATRNSISDIIRLSDCEMMTVHPISSLEKWTSIPETGQKLPPILKSSPDTQAPDIPTILQPLFYGCGVPSPTICDSFNFARMDPISPAPARDYRDSNWPAKQDQVQMACFEAVSQLLPLTPPIRSEGYSFDRRWEPRTPQPQPSTVTTTWIPHTPQPQPSHFFNQFAEPSLQKSQSLVAMWERIEQPGPSVAPLVPLPSPEQQLHQAEQPITNKSGTVFEIGYHTARNYSQIKTPVLKLEGRNPKDPISLCRPWGICCHQNLVYVADRSNDRIAIFSTDGMFVYAFGIRGEKPGEFNRPAGLAIDSQGRLVIADKDNHRIQVFSTDGEYLFHFGRYGNQHGEFFYPWDVACSSDGHIAVTDTRNHRVQIFTSSGVFIRKYGWESRPAMMRELDSPRGVIFVKNNVLLVTDFNNHRIIQITFGDRVCMGQFNKTNHPKSTLSRPQGLALDAEGNVLVCDSKNDRIVVFSPKGEFIGEFGKRGKEDGQFDRCVDISVASDGKIAVVDLHQNRVQIF